MGQSFNEIAAAPWIDGSAGSRFLLDQDLGIAGDACGKIGGQGQRFVEGIGVERLGVTMGGSERFDAGSGHIVHDILSGERPARGLTMGTQRQ